MKQMAKVVKVPYCMLRFVYIYILASEPETITLADEKIEIPESDVTPPIVASVQENKQVNEE